MKLLAILLLVCSAGVPGQEVPQVRGQVVDSSGLPVSGAVLSLNRPSTGRQLLSLSASDGTYRFDKLEPGAAYELKAYREGLASSVRVVQISSPDEKVSIRLQLSPRIRFEDVTEKSGLNFTLATGADGHFYQPEIMGGGVAALDFNNDGCMDLFFVNGAVLPSAKKTSPAFSNRLYRNNCDLTFTDVTAGSGLSGEGYGIGAAVADYDNDGLPDIFVTGLRSNHLYRNRGKGVFEDITGAAGLNLPDPTFGRPWSISAGWFDYDNDGYLDLFVANYVSWEPGLDLCKAAGKPFYCHPRVYRPLPNRLYHNNRNGTFTDVSEAAGIRKSLGKGMGLAFGDYDGDGLQDVFVANDSVPNFLFRNRGDGTFKEVALEAGVAYPGNGNSVAGMGADFRDLDNDGREDIVFTAMYFDTFPFFRNHGAPGFFSDDTASAGVALATKDSTGWGMGIYDFDNDGNKDLFFATSHFPGYAPYPGSASETSNQVLLNLGNGSFANVSQSAGAALERVALYHGAAFADFDNDGRVDVVVTASDSSARLLRNVSAESGNWIAFRLKGTKSNKDGIGALARITLPTGKMLFNRATTCVGYASSSEPLIRFGLGPYQSVKEVQIRWPSGKLQTLAELSTGRVHTVTEP